MAEAGDSNTKIKMLKEANRKQSVKRTSGSKTLVKQSSKAGKINVLPQINQHILKGTASATGKVPTVQQDYESLFDSQDRSIRKAKSGVTIVKSKKRPPLPKQSNKNPSRYLESSGKQRSTNPTSHQVSQEDAEVSNWVKFQIKYNSKYI